ncbi:ribosomal protein L7 [Trichuris trichiura]|uniref:Ribosomal protein L7 n=1 Tax=Trichuris trichiura TaxID=36087 RepID=A0A077ZHQ9_TRITR|nr:ribosomal protein L7 [Trichuris trichiura]
MPKKLPYVDESEKARARRKSVKRAEYFVLRSRRLVSARRRLQHLSRLVHLTESSVERRLIFVLRIKGRQNMHPKVKKILNLLRLRYENSGVFLNTDKATLRMLAAAQRFITWGHPNLRSVRELIYKRAAVVVNGKRLQLSDNRTIEDSLGSYNIVCIEDLIHEIFTIGPHFKIVNNFVLPFRLSKPSGGWTKKKSSFSHGGDFGDRKEAINDLLRLMV